MEGKHTRETWKEEGSNFHELQEKVSNGRHDDDADKEERHMLAPELDVDIHTKKKSHNLKTTCHRINLP